MSEPIPDQVCDIIEAALLAAGEPLSIDRLTGLFAAEEEVDRAAIRAALEGLERRYAGRGIEVAAVASGYRLQVGARMAPWVNRLWERKPPRYSRALLETLALIAYQQPVTRGDIEQVRGVSVSSNIIKTLLERDWISVLGHRDVPGRPALYGTTRGFLDHFNLQGLDELPALAAIRDLDKVSAELGLESGEGDLGSDEQAEDEAVSGLGSDAETAESRGDREELERPVPGEAGDNASYVSSNGDAHDGAADRDDRGDDERPSADVVRLPVDRRT